MYLEETQSLFHQQDPDKEQEYKERVYSIFKYYHTWCLKEDAYDLMDMVNHILRETEIYGYSGPKIDCMFID
jgi:hypothetical protein